MTVAGGTTSTSQSCPVWSITVNLPFIGNITLTTPSACFTDKTVRSSDCFDCGPPSQDNNCTAQGFQVTVQVYSIGGGSACPTILASLPTTILEANMAMSCKPLPMTSSSQVWCAKVTKCDTGKEESPYSHGEVRTSGNDTHTVFLSDPSESLPGPQPDPLYEQIQAAQTLPIDQLPPPLRDSVMLHPAVPGVGRLSATVDVQFANVAGFGSIQNSYVVAGTAGPGGWFSISNPQSFANENGGADTLTVEMYYDGATFVWGVRGAPFYQAFPSSCSKTKSMLHTVAGFMAPLSAWVDSPFSVLRFAGTTYQTETFTEGSATFARVTESYAQVTDKGEWGRTVYTIALEPVPHPTRTDILDNDGNVLLRREFSQYRALATDVWRPFRVVESFFEPGSNAPAITRTMVISAAAVLSTEQTNAALVRPHSEENWWFVHQ